MRTVVIGANGHIGTHLVRELLHENIQVRALVRPTSDMRGLAGIPCEVVRGDILDPASLAVAIRDCDTVFHLAAPTSITDGLSSAIIDGTRNVLEQAMQAGVKRVVYTSSVVTVGYSDSVDTILDESCREKSRATPYHQAKAEAENFVLEFGMRTGLQVVIVNPATVVGALDYRVTPSNRPIQQCLDSGLPFAFHSGLTVVHARDVARGHWLAMQRGKPGERYILGGDRITVPEYFRLICRLCGRRPPLLNMPRAVMLLIGASLSIAGGLGVKNVPFTLTQVRLLAGRYGWYSSARARKELGYAWRSVEDSVKSYVDWARSGRPSEP